MGKRAPNNDGFIDTPNMRTPEPPVPLGERSYCGALDIRIDAEGTWHYNASPIRRAEMVCLFASMLMRDDQGRHWLVTPTEVGMIDVDDAPFIAVDLYGRGRGRDMTLSFRTNVDRVVTVTPETPLVVHDSPATGRPAPYVVDHSGLEAKLTRSVYYDLVAWGEMQCIDGQDVFGVWSGGTFFPMGKIDDCDA